MDEAAKDKPILRRVGRPKKVEKVSTVAEFIAPLNDAPRTLEVTDAAVRARAQDYANRVWVGQSISEHRPWRVQRVKEALEGQGLPCDGVIVGGLPL